MAVFDVELLAVPSRVSLESVSAVTGLSDIEAGALLACLPTVIAHRVDESEAEVLFHDLTSLGASVKLHPVVGSPSRRPGVAGSVQLPPASSRPPAPPSPAPAAFVSAHHARSAPPVAPIDLPLDLPGLDGDFELEPAPVGGPASEPPSSHFGDGSMLEPWSPDDGGPLLEPVPASGSAPPEPGPIDVRRPVSAPPAGPFGGPSSRPPRPLPRPSAPDPASGPPPPYVVPSAPDPTGTFFEDILLAYLYPFRPPVLLVAALAAIPFLFLSVQAGVGCSGLLFMVVGTFLKLGIAGLFVFWLMRHACSGRESALPKDSDVGRADAITDIGLRILFIFLPLVPVFFFGGSPAREIFAFCWVLYLPAAFILAYFDDGWFGGLEIISGFMMIARAPLRYLLLLVSSLPLFAVAAFLYLGTSTALFLSVATWSGSSLFASGLFAFAFMLVAAAIARLLGRFILRYAGALGFG